MVYQGPERRNVDREETLIEKHAQRAAETRFQWNPETERAEDNTGHTITTASFDGGVNFRELLIAAAFDQKTRPQAPTESVVTIFSQYEMFLNSLDLSPVDKHKLKEMMKPDNYQIACQTAQEMGPAPNLPTYGRIAVELMKLPPERLKEICEIQQKPTIIIVMPNSFDQKLATMNRHKHYTGRNGMSQQDVKCDQGLGSPYKDAPQMATGKVSIVDGIPHPKLPNVPPRLGVVRDYLIKQFAAKKMRLIDKDEIATLAQQSLIESQKTNDNSRIIDNCDSEVETRTMIDSQSLSNQRYGTYYFFSLNNRRPYFRYFYPDRIDEKVCGRAAFQLLEF